MISHYLIIIETGCGMCVSQLCLTLCDPITIAHQAPLSMRFSRQEYWSELPLPTPVDLPNSEIEFTCLVSPTLATGFFTTSTTWDEVHDYQFMFV